MQKLNFFAFTIPIKDIPERMDTVRQTITFVTIRWNEVTSLAPVVFQCFLY